MAGKVSAQVAMKTMHILQAQVLTTQEHVATLYVTKQIPHALIAITMGIIFKIGFCPENAILLFDPK